jgi:hypothetical protein
VRLDGSAHWWYVRYLGEEVLSSFESDDDQGGRSHGLSRSSTKVRTLASQRESREQREAGAESTTPAAVMAVHPDQGWVRSVGREGGAHGSTIALSTHGQERARNGTPIPLQRLAKRCDGVGGVAAGPRWWSVTAATTRGGRRRRAMSGVGDTMVRATVASGVGTPRSRAVRHARQHLPHGSSAPTKPLPRLRSATRLRVLVIVAPYFVGIRFQPAGCCGRRSDQRAFVYGSAATGPPPQHVRQVPVLRGPVRKRS